MNGRLSSLRVELLRILICSEPAILSKIQIWNGGRTETPKKVSIREDGRVFLFYGSGPLWWQRLFNTYESVSIIDASISIADAITGSNSTRNEFAFDEITKSIIDEAKKRKDFDCIVDILFDCMRTLPWAHCHNHYPLTLLTHLLCLHHRTTFLLPSFSVTSAFLRNFRCLMLYQRPKSSNALPNTNSFQKQTFAPGISQDDGTW